MILAAQKGTLRRSVSAALFMEGYPEKVASTAVDLTVWPALSSGSLPIPSFSPPRSFVLLVFEVFVLTDSGTPILEANETR